MTQIKHLQQSGQLPNTVQEGDFAPFIQHLGAAFLSFFAALWTLGLWFAGRLARRRLGRLRGHRPSILMFRLHQRYIFLLILALILEIFSILSKREALAYVAWPLLTVVAIACFVEGVGVVLFQVAVRRVAAGRRVGFGPGLVLVALCLFFWPFMLVLGLLGLADVWFDFRRLETIGRQLGL